MRKNTRSGSEAGQRDRRGKGGEGTLGSDRYAVWEDEGGAGGAFGPRRRYAYTRSSDAFGRGTGGTAQAGQGTGKRDPAVERRERVFRGSQRFFAASRWKSGGTAK